MPSKLWISLCFGIACVAPGSIADDSTVSFQRDVLPVLSKVCFECHGPDENTRKKDLRLDKRDALFGQTGDGAPIIVPGDSENSELVYRITTEDEDDAMPPRKHRNQLSDPEITMIKAWIESGAEWQQHWAFRSPKRPDIPKVSRKFQQHNAIDAFIQNALKQIELQPSPEADKAILIRRLSLDLIGLPPTPDEVDKFLSDDSGDAYEKLVDRLLASPRYGEHMAVGWMELARYADTDGYQNDRYRYMHVWRDWVIHAFNANKPYDQFIIEQLAGDMLPDATLRQQIASGFNRNHRINSENGSIPAEWLVENVVDRVDTFGTAFLGLTMSCARCHDHKYDLISQREYYQLYAHFNRVPEWGVGPNNGNSPPFVRVPDSWPNLAPEENRKITPEPYKLRESKTSVTRPQAGSPKTVMVMQEEPGVRPTYLLKRGLYDQPDTSEELYPSIPAVLTYDDSDPPKNRLELARWLVSPEHPLTSRVAVNRIWQHFFGTGIVRTSENFGVQGEYPSHPELLDWLAAEFIRLDWDIKAIQKRIVMSATYRQSSNVTPDHLEHDPENRFIARAPRLRLTAQQLRDQALYASGLLVRDIGGPSVKPYMPEGLWESVSNEEYDQGGGEDLYRRSIYTYWRRTTPPPMMVGFNAANRETCSVRTEKINSPLHALTLMNNPIFVESSRHMAERVFEMQSRTRPRIQTAFKSVLGRDPDTLELNALMALFTNYVEQFQKSPERAEGLLHVGESPHSVKFDPATLAGMAMVCSAILNLDEAVMRN